MKQSWWMILLFAAMALAQWWVPFDMITGSKRILEEGTPMKFRCAPVDPNDPFRGKYIILNFDIARFEMDTIPGLKDGQTVYLELKEDSIGFVQIEKVEKNPPNTNKPYLKTSVDYINRYGMLGENKQDSSVYEINFNIPFNRLYLEESKAPQAEDIYRTGLSDSTGYTYGLVYLLNGEARIKDVFIRDTSLMERLRNLNR
jgi:uncharacterized membrane-anchored protein